MIKPHKTIARTAETWMDECFEPQMYKTIDRILEQPNFCMDKSVY